MSQIDMDGVLSTNHKAFDIIPPDLILSSRIEATWMFTPCTSMQNEAKAELEV